eukprot:3071187-Rhodomonas_salina.1
MRREVKDQRAQRVRTHARIQHGRTPDARVRQKPRRKGIGGAGSVAHMRDLPPVVVAARFALLRPRSQLPHFSRRRQ